MRCNVACRKSTSISSSCWCDLHAAGKTGTCWCPVGVATSAQPPEVDFCAGAPSLARGKLSMMIYIRKGRWLNAISRSSWLPPDPAAPRDRTQKVWAQAVTGIAQQRGRPTQGAGGRAADIIGNASRRRARSTLVMAGGACWRRGGVRSFEPHAACMATLGRHITPTFRDAVVGKRKAHLALE